MIYNDFPILNNSQYEILSEQYSKSLKPDRKTHIIKICNELNNTISSCFQLENKYNTKIIQSINQSKQTLIKLLDNISSCFNISPSSQHQISNFSLFSFIKKLILLSSLITEWTNFEEKEYYKSVARKSVLELLNCINNLITALELSNINFFKHM